MIGYVFYRLRSVLKKEPLLKMKTGMWALHLVALALYFFWWALYEVAYYFWVLDPNAKTGVSDKRLVILAVIELCFNTFSCVLSGVLFYMVDKMTVMVQDEYFDPILKRHVPFFVYLANCKLVLEHSQR